MFFFPDPFRSLKLNFSGIKKRSFYITGHRLSIDLLHLKHQPMIRHRIVLSFDVNLNHFYSVKVNLLDFNDANDSIIFSIDGDLSRCTCIKSGDSSLSSVMVDLIADRVLFNLCCKLGELEIRKNFNAYEFMMQSS